MLTFIDVAIGEVVDTLSLFLAVHPTSLIDIAC